MATENELMCRIFNCYNRLSPENVSCDGELPMAQVRKRVKALQFELNQLFRELGRTVDEQESYDWWLETGRNMK